MRDDFKAGDRVRVLYDSGGLVKGEVRTVESTGEPYQDGSYMVNVVDGRAFGYSNGQFELVVVEHPSLKTGDKVVPLGGRVNSYAFEHHGLVPGRVYTLGRSLAGGKVGGAEMFTLIPPTGKDGSDWGWAVTRFRHATEEELEAVKVQSTQQVLDEAQEVTGQPGQVRGVLEEGGVGWFTPSVSTADDGWWDVDLPLIVGDQVAEEVWRQYTGLKLELRVQLRRKVQD